MVGPSGCGKSTLLRCINALEPTQSGRVRLGNETVAYGGKGLTSLRQRIGMVFQSYELFPHLTVLDNILLAPMKVQKRNKEEVKKEAEQLLDRVGLLDKKDNYPRQLSGGQKQRLSIARALVRRPRILILDDSTSALDYATDAKLRKAIRELTYHPTTFIVSQRTSSICYADEIIVLDDGEVVGIGNHEQLMEQCPVYQEIHQSQFQDRKEA